MEKLMANNCTQMYIISVGVVVSQWGKMKMNIDDITHWLVGYSVQFVMHVGFVYLSTYYTLASLFSHAILYLTVPLGRGSAHPETYIYTGNRI